MAPTATDTEIRPVEELIGGWKDQLNGLVAENWGDEFKARIEDIVIDLRGQYLTFKIPTKDISPTRRLVDEQIELALQKKCTVLTKEIETARIDKFIDSLGELNLDDYELDREMKFNLKALQQLLCSDTPDPKIKEQVNKLINGNVQSKIKFDALLTEGSLDLSSSDVAHFIRDTAAAVRDKDLIVQPERVDTLVRVIDTVAKKGNSRAQKLMTHYTALSDSVDIINEFGGNFDLNGTIALAFHKFSDILNSETRNKTLTEIGDTIAKGGDKGLEMLERISPTLSGALASFANPVMGMLGVTHTPGDTRAPTSSGTQREKSTVFLE